MQSEKLIKKLNQIRAELDQLEEVIRKDLAVEETISQIPPPPVERAQEIIESEKKEKTEEQAPPPLMTLPPLARQAKKLAKTKELY